MWFFWKFMLRGYSNLCHARQWNFFYQKIFRLCWFEMIPKWPSLAPRYGIQPFFQLKKGVLKNIFVACFNADRKTWSPVVLINYPSSLSKSRLVFAGKCYADLGPFQSLVRLLLAEEFFLMSTQIPTCWLCRETLLLSSTSLKGLRTQPRKYVVTEDSIYFLK